MMSQVAFIEIIGTDRHRTYRSERFGFFKTLLQERGVTVRWGCLGVPQPHITEGGNLCVFNLSDDELSAVLAFLVKTRPELVLINEVLAPPVVARLNAELPDCEVMFMTEQLEHGSLDQLLERLEVDQALWIGESSAEELAAPDFQRIPLLNRDM